MFGSCAPHAGPVYGRTRLAVVRTRRLGRSLPIFVPFGLCCSEKTGQRNALKAECTTERHATRLSCARLGWKGGCKRAVVCGGSCAMACWCYELERHS